MRLKQLQETRGSLMKQAKAIVDTAAAEKRALNDADNIRLSGIKGEILDVDVELTREREELQRLTRNSPGSNRYRGDFDPSQYSLLRAMRGQSVGRLDGYEAECSQEIAHRSGKAPDGFYVPHAVLMEQRAGMTVTQDSGDYGGNTVATEIRGFIDALRPMLMVARAGATLMSGLEGNVGIPRHVAASTASWKGEIGAVDEQTPEIEQLLLSPKRIGAWTKFSKQLLAQSSLDVENFVRNDLMAAIAVGFDLAAIAGSGTSDQPRGILATSGIGSIAGGANGLAPTFAHLTGLVSTVANLNALTGRPGFLINTKTENKLRNTVKVASTDSKMLLEEGQTTIAGQPWYSSNNVPSNLDKGTSTGVCSAIIFGNWADLILASFGSGVDVVIDPFTLATTSQTRVVLNSLCDVGVRRAESFAAMKDALTA